MLFICQLPKHIRYESLKGWCPSWWWCLTMSFSMWESARLHLSRFICMLICIHIYECFWVLFRLSLLVSLHLICNKIEYLQVAQIIFLVGCEVYLHLLLLKTSLWRRLKTHMLSSEDESFHLHLYYNAFQIISVHLSRTPHVKSLATWLKQSSTFCSEDTMQCLFPLKQSKNLLHSSLCIYILHTV